MKEKEDEISEWKKILNLNTPIGDPTLRSMAEAYIAMIRDNVVSVAYSSIARKNVQKGLKVYCPL